jgi:hypothetical protein
MALLLDPLNFSSDEQQNYLYHLQRKKCRCDSPQTHPENTNSASFKRYDWVGLSAPLLEKLYKMIMCCFSSLPLGLLLRYRSCQPFEKSRYGYKLPNVEAIVYETKFSVRIGTNWREVFFIDEWDAYLYILRLFRYDRQSIEDCQIYLRFRIRSGQELSWLKTIDLAKLGGEPCRELRRLWQCDLK